MKAVRCQRIQYGEVCENRTFGNKYIRKEAGDRDMKKGMLREESGGAESQEPREGLRRDGPLSTATEIKRECEHLQVENPTCGL